MRIAPTGWLFLIAPWILAIILPFWIVSGRLILGVQGGWLSVFGSFLEPVMAILLIVPPLVVLYDTEACRVRGVRVSYAIFTSILWIVLFLCSLALTDRGDGDALPSALSIWFGLTEETSSAIHVTLIFIASLAWIAAIAAASIGVSRSRTRQIS